MPRKTKIGRGSPRLTQGQKVKGQLAGGGGILWRPPAQLVSTSSSRIVTIVIIFLFKAKVRMILRTGKS